MSNIIYTETLLAGTPAPILAPRGNSGKIHSAANRVAGAWRTANYGKSSRSGWTRFTGATACRPTTS